MILRKPYAFFIKMFKPIHLLLAILISILIYFDNRILNFLNRYIYSYNDVVGQNIRKVLVNDFLILIPVILIIFSLIILVVMFKKKKPITFYFVNILCLIVIIIINLYASNFLGILEENIVAVKSVKLVHDLVLINIMIETIIFIFLAIRGMGLNIKKFDFSSDLSKMDISESDKEEFELDISVDLEESKRKRRRKLRHLKYVYIENKFLVNCILIVVICICSLVIYGTASIYTKTNKEGTMYSADRFSFGVNKTVILNTNFRNEKITDNYLIVVNTSLQSNIPKTSLFLTDFSLKIGEAIFKPTINYSNSLLDLGVSYNKNELEQQYKNYLFTYEIPKK